jgi:streptomycin 3"-adenylyltransferase
VHVIGSATLGDYRPGMSDLDLVVTLTNEASAGEIAEIAQAHSGEHAFVSAVYLPPGALDVPPEAVTCAPWVRDGEAHTSRWGELHAVTWLQLASHSATIHGDRPTTRPDVVAAQDFSRANLRSYWSPLLDDAQARLEGASSRREGIVWLGLGPARLWHTIVTGEIVSKTRAGVLAAARWPDLAEHLTDIVAARNANPIPLTSAHARTAIELGRRVLAQARPN